jgi:polysaccharide export outer membrane protein
MPWAPAGALAFCALCAAQGPVARAPAAAGPSEYSLGPGDQIVVHALDIDEINEKSATIDGRGFVKLPLAGRIHAGGLTVPELETAVAAQLKVFVRDPQVAISIAEYRSQPVSVLGAVASPGVQQLQGRKTLFELLSMAGGLRADAGHSIKITRRKEWGRIPLASADDDVTGQFSVAEVSVTSVMEARNPQENIAIRPHDVISVPRAEMVYVIGAVKRAGGFVLNEKENMTVLQALSLAEGLDRTAAPARARILRPAPGGGPRAEMSVDLRRIIAGKSGDVALHADDILFVPASAAKSATVRGLEAAVQIGTGIAIWRH